jgi:23S rRNA (adenine2503-C2)-methyltransferase
MDRVQLKGLNQEEIDEFITSIGEPSYRGKQLFKWIYQKGETDFDKMTDFGKALRSTLALHAEVSAIEVLQVQHSLSGDTEKYLFRLHDGHLIESVVMSYEDHIGPSRMTACISTQVGCAMGCRFCASAVGGVKRNLTCGEIVDQVLQLQLHLASREMRVANVVMMGIGEPFENYDQVMAAVKLLNHPDGLTIGSRHMAISTCGVIPGIMRFADEGIQVKLAISLHSPFDDVRSSLMPINRKYPLADLMKALRHYQDTTGRRITIEYALIQGVNDREEDARALLELLNGFTALINLIPLNLVREYGLERTSRSQAERFRAWLDEEGIRTTIRKERGIDIDAACGQLRRKTMGGDRAELSTEA